MSRPAPFESAGRALPEGAGPLGAFRRPELARWAPVVGGLLVLYAPTYLELYRNYWGGERDAHGPLILLVSAWLAWRERGAFAASGDRPMRRAGWLLILIGLAAYVLGRSQGVIQLETGSQIALFAGLVLALTGPTTLRRLAFPILYLAFLIPLPGSLLDAILLPLKQLVSMVCDELLHLAGYPVARTGVVLQIGAYQLLIADACSGLNSMVALSGIGVLFVYLVAPVSRAHAVILLASVLPIAFVANVARVMILLLVTYHFGDAAGSTFHDQAGYMEILFAFGAFFAFNALLARGLRAARPARPA